MHHSAGALGLDSVAVYFWETTGQWIALAGTYASEQRAATALVQEAGVYVLVSSDSVVESVGAPAAFLPLIAR